MSKLYFNSVTVFFALGMLSASGNVVADYSKSFEGYKVFNTYCFLCHGEKGKGNGPLAKNLMQNPLT